MGHGAWRILVKRRRACVALTAVWLRAATEGPWRLRGAEAGAAPAGALAALMTRGAAVCHIRSPAVKAKTSASTGRTKESGQLPLRWAMGPQRAGEASLDTGAGLGARPLRTPCPPQGKLPAFD